MPPVMCKYGNTVENQQQMSRTEPRRNSSSSTNVSSTIQTQQQKIYEPSVNAVSPHKLSICNMSVDPYGYPGVNHQLAHISTPPLPVISKKSERNISQMVGRSDLFNPQI